MFSIKGKKKPAAAEEPNGPKARRTPAGWENERQRSAATQAAKSRAGRDIAPGYPEVINPQRKAQAKESFEYFCRAYLPLTFNLPWSQDHRRAIELIERVVKEGGLFAIAMPRGSGKTSLVEAAAMWATLYGYRQFVVIIGSDESAALELLESIKSELENNDLLAEDFPEVCYPIKCLEGIAHRANGQLFHGERTHIQWTANELVYPTIPGSVASGAVVRVTGITGRIRGMKFKRPDGRSVRPDLAIPDDPQTDESAKSPSQTAERERIIAGAVLGLAGPSKKIAAIMPCTVIAPDDLADRALDRNRNPQWQGERTKMLVSFPSDELLWETYAKVRADSLRAGSGGREATDFYKANREAMDAGAVASWPVRFNPDELSAIQHAMNLKLANPRAFFAEYQNDPQRDEDVTQAELLTAEQIAAKTNGLGRGEVPAAVTRLVAYVDVQQNVLYWAVCGFEDDFTGYVVDYGTFPDQNREHFRLNDVRQTLKSVLKVKSLEEALRQGLERLAAQLLDRDWVKDDESKIRVERMLIDYAWAPSQDTVHAFCRESTHSAIVMPAKGVGIGAASRPFNDHKPKRGERRGAHWRTTLTTDRPVQRRMLIDTNHYKSFTHERLGVERGGRGCLSLYGSDPTRHRMLAEHLLAEDPVKVTAKGQTVIEWKDRPSKPDNHMLDCVSGCHAAAAERGTALVQLKGPEEKARTSVPTFAQAKKSRQVHRGNRK